MVFQKYLNDLFKVYKERTSEPFVSTVTKIEIGRKLLC